MKSNLTLLLLICLAHPGLSQPAAKRDSLLRMFNKTPTDSARVQVLLDIAKLHPTATDARPWIDRAMALSRQANYGLGIANCLTNYNRFLYEEGKYDEVMRNCREGLRLANPYRAHKTIGVLYNTMGNVYSEKGQSEQALTYYLQALDEIRQADVPTFFHLTIESNIARLYNALREYPKALKTGLRCLAEAERIGDHQQVAYTSQHVAEAYQALKQPQKSRAYWINCRSAAERVGNQTLIATALTNIGDLYADENQSNRAIACFRQSLAIARATRNPQIEMWNLHGIAIARFFEKNYTDAYNLTQQARRIAEANGYRDYQADIYRLLADIAFARGNLPEGDRWGNRWKGIRNELVNKTVLEATQELETRYQTRQKTAQIRSLEQRRQIQELALRQKNLLIAGLIGLVLLLGLIGWLYYRNSRHKQQLAEQETQISQQRIRQLEQDKQLAAAEGVLRGQEEERSRLARDLHDGLGGMLSGVKSSLMALQGRSTGLDSIMPHDSARSFDRVINYLETSIQELRRVARNMMPEALVRFGLDDALRDYVGHLNSSGNQPIDYQSFGMEKRLPQTTEIIVFRIVQELLNNVQKHAEATQTLVQLIRDGSRFHLTVEDNGRGFDTGQLENQPGIGWLNIRSRVDYLNGTLDVAASPGRGTSVNIECMVA